MGFAREMPPTEWPGLEMTGVTKLTDDIYCGWVDGHANPVFWHWCAALADVPPERTVTGRWVAANPEGHTLVAREPLHLEPSLLWSCCGLHGFVRERKVGVGMTVSGIDIASYQNSTFNTSGLGFVGVKATEGTGYVNPKHDAQVAYGRAHGLLVIHYHFQRPGDPAAQVAYFLQHAKVQPGDVLACDWEDTGVSSANKDSFIRHTQAAAPAHKSGLYCNRDFWFNRDSSSFAGDFLWIADPEAAIGHPRVDHPWTIHQYGIKGADLDVANFPSAAAMRAWASGSKPPAPTPKPKPLAPAKRVRLHVAVWAATHSEADERKYPQNEPEIYAIQEALVANKRIATGHFLPGIFDTPTRTAYAAEQRAQHYTGTAADGIPGLKSLTHLGKQHGFTVAE